MSYLEDSDLHTGPHEWCRDTSVTTKSGRFTFHNLSRTVRAAKDFCRAKGEILAPVTNWDDFHQLRNFTDGCTNLGGSQNYLVGLDVFDERTRYFTNGRVYEESEHGPLYRMDEPVKGTKFPRGTCYYSTLDVLPSVTTLMVNANPGCRYQEHLFICLKPRAVPPKC